MIKKIKNLFNRKHRQSEQIRKALEQARLNEIKRLEKIHGKKVEKIVYQLNTEKQIEIENLNAELNRVTAQNEKLKKRNEYCEKLYYEAIEIAKTNSITSQEMSTDATRLENELVRITGLIHGINNKAQRHYEKLEKDKMKVKNKLNGSEG
jgi:hypothetical protein